MFSSASERLVTSDPYLRSESLQVDGDCWGAVYIAYK